MNVHTHKIIEYCMIKTGLKEENTKGKEKKRKINKHRERVIELNTRKKIEQKITVETKYRQEREN